MPKKVVIIGGGASGLVCAISMAKWAKQQGQEIAITLVERMDRIGKKILVTGNGRCNLSNKQISPLWYHSNQPSYLGEILSQMPCDLVLDFFSDCGLLYDTKPDGKVYPSCNQASVVLDVLRQELSSLNVAIQTDFDVCSITKQTDGFLVQTFEGESLSADIAVLATGGRAMQKLGANGSGYRLSQQLGHHRSEIAPALVPLKSSARFLKSLKGIRANVTASLWIDGCCVRQEPGEVQFTEYGLSGICIMQLSHLLPQPIGRRSAFIMLDLFPQLTEDQLVEKLTQRQSQTPLVETLLLGMLHKKISSTVLKTIGGFSLGQTCDSITKQQLLGLASTLKRWCFPISGTLSFEQAQVTSGGILLEEINTTTMTSLQCENLYIIGELLDATGLCGGFNLHFAFASGILAGRAIAKSLC